MNFWAVNVKNTHGGPFLVRNSIPWKPISWNLQKMGSFDGRILEIRFLKRNSCYAPSGCQSFVVQAMGKKNPQNSDSSSSSSGNGDQSIPEGESLKGSPSESNKTNGTGSHKSQHKILNWREFRALLVHGEQGEAADSDTHKQEGTTHAPRHIGLKWAHPLSSPEVGCVLVATEKLDGVRTFERTVVLLLRSGTRHPQEGPFGVVINRPLHKKMKHMKPTNPHLVSTFADCPLHFGGPLEASMFLLRTGEKTQLPGFEEVIPGLSFSARNSLEEAAGLVNKGVLKPQDLRFFAGYAGWQLDQLKEEIESNYWYIAACSPDLLFSSLPNSSSERLWEEILQLMGGHYSELSRKPKHDM